MGEAIYAIGAAVWGWLQNEVVRFIVTAAISFTLAKKAAEDAIKTNFRGIQSTSRGALEYRKFGYGEALVGGNIIFNNTRDVNNQWMDYWLTYVDHYAELVEFKLDAQDVGVGSINWTPAESGGTGDANCTLAAYTGKNSVRALKISWSNGWVDQVAPARLISEYGELSSSDRARGVFNAVMSFLYTEDTQDVWRKLHGGPPQSVAALLKMRRVYDRRRYALNSDPDFTTSKLDYSTVRNKWFSTVTQSASLGSTFSWATDTLTLTSDANQDVYSERIPVDTAKRYTVRVDGRQTAGTRVQYLGVAFFDSNGDNIVGTGSGATGWASLGTYFYYHAAAVFAGTYTEYSTDFGVSGTASIPAGAVEMCFVMQGNYSGSGSTTIDVQDAAIFESTTRHDIADSATWEWSDNNANCMADYLVNFMGADPADEIDWDACIVAAQACDETVTTPDGSQKRFTCNGAWMADLEHEEMLDAIRLSMAGRLVYTGGMWVMSAGVMGEIEYTFNEDCLAGDIEVMGSANRDERFNIIKGFYVDPDRDYVPVEFYAQTNSAYVTRDGGQELSADIDLAFVNSEFQAQRVARLVLDQFDNQLAMSTVMNEQGAKCYPGQFVKWTLSEFSWTEKVFRVLSWKPRADGNFDVVFREDYATRYDDMLVGEYTVKTAGGVIVPGTFSVTPPANLAATGVEGAIVYTWDSPPASIHDSIELWVATTNDRSLAVKVASLKANQFQYWAGDVTERFAWIRALKGAEEYSAWEPTSSTAGVAATPTAAGLAIWQYIKPTDGTAIKNGTGTLTIEAREVSSGVDSLLSAGTVKLYVGTTEVTVANGYAAGSDGYTGVFDSGDINGNVVVELKDGPAGTVIDSITLVDIEDGLTGGAGAPGDTYGGVNISDWETYPSDTGTPYSAGLQFKADFTNNRLYVRPHDTGVGSGTLSYEYDLEVVGTTVTGVTGISTNAVIENNLAPIDWGVDDAAEGRILWGSNGVTHDETLTLGSGTNNDEYYLSLAALDDTISFRVKVRHWNVADGAISIGDRWSQRITKIDTVDDTYTQLYFGIQTGQVVIWKGALASAPSNPILNWAYYNTTDSKAYIWDGDSWETLAADGSAGLDAVYGYIEATNGLAYVRAVNAGAWSPNTSPTDLECTFVKAGVEEARIARRISLNSSTGELTVSVVAHSGGDFNTGRVTVSTAGAPGAAVTVEFSYSFGGDVAAVSERVASVIGGTDGETGPGGYNAATLTAYKRAASAPTDDPGASITYTFATAAWTPGNGWSKTIPAGSDPLYALSATAYSQSATDDILSADWSSPTLILQDGADGTSGLNIATAYIYQRTATDVAPTLPSVTATYTFSTGNITGLNNGWTDTIPAAGSNPFLWVSLATASSSGSSDDIGSGEWQAAQHLAEDGTDGTNGDPGIPGLPGANYLIDYWNADTNGSSSSSGRYHLLTTITDTSGTLSWSTWVTPGGVDYLSVHKDGKTAAGSATDYSDFYDQTEVGDVVTIWRSTRKWVSFRITSIETAPTDMYKWGIIYISHDDDDGTTNLDEHDVVHRWSRVYVAPDAGPRITPRPASVTDIEASANAGAGYKVDNNGSCYTSTATPMSWVTNLGTWKETGVVADYECAFFVTASSPVGKTPSGSSINTYLSCSTDRSWYLETTGVSALESVGGQVIWRDATTGEVLASAPVTLSVQTET